MLLANVTCVSVGGGCLLFEGPPGRGKSTLALALIDRGGVLVGDDGVALEVREGRLWATPPPNIAGKLEVRGVGIVEMDTAEAPLALILTLDPDAPRMPEPSSRKLLDHEIPAIPFRPGDAAQAMRAELALEHFELL